MMRKSNLKLYISIFLFLICPVLYAADNWIIAAQKFSTNEGNSQVYNILGETFPSLILSSMGNNLNRDVSPDEKYERIKYQLEKERLSLFLQLSAEYKKKDKLVLGDYTQKQLAKKQKEADERIKEIELELSKNLEKQQTEKRAAEKNQALVDSGKYSEKRTYSEGEKWLYLFKNMFVKNDNLIDQEYISFYKGDITQLFTPSQNAIKDGIGSYAYEKEVNESKINALIAGKISIYGDYLSVNVDTYSFPGGNKLISVMEVGTLRELETIASNISTKLVPAITNALPVEIELNFYPSEITDVKFYLDDSLVKNTSEKLLLQSGIHTFQVEAEGFKSISSTYNFQGNHRYTIEITMEPELNAYLYLFAPGADSLSIYANGESVTKLDDQHAKIKINGQTILGQFVNTDGLSDFYYINQKSQITDSTVKVKAKVRNNADYIEKRRKLMYGSYSALMISIIPTFVCKGQFNNYANAYLTVPNQESYEKAMRWATAADISTYVTLGCGVFFGYELVRYLMAANSVLPKKAKNTDIIYFETKSETSETPENIHTEE